MPASILYRLLCRVIRLLARVGGADQRDSRSPSRATSSRFLPVDAPRDRATPTPTVRFWRRRAVSSRVSDGPGLVGPDTLARWHRDLL